MSVINLILNALPLLKGVVYVDANTLDLIKAGNMKKGDVLTVARIAGIMGAKKTSELIPLCHPVPITKIGVDLSLDEDCECDSDSGISTNNW